MLEEVGVSGTCRDGAGVWGWSGAGGPASRGGGGWEEGPATTLLGPGALAKPIPDPEISAPALCVGIALITFPLKAPAALVDLQLQHGADVLGHGELAEDRGLLRQV